MQEESATQHADEHANEAETDTQDKAKEAEGQNTDHDTNTEETKQEDKQEEKPEDKTSKFKPIESQEELDKILGERLKRERAKYADYDTYKQKAAEFDEIKAKHDAAMHELEALKSEKQINNAIQQAAKENNVPAHLIKGQTEEEIQAHAAELASALKNTPTRIHLPHDGQEPKNGAPVTTADLFGEFLLNKFSR